MQQCPSCQYEMPEDAHYCGHCGYVLNDSTIRIWKRTPLLLQKATAVSATDDSAGIPSHRAWLDNAPAPLRAMLLPLVVRARDPEPEVLSTSAASPQQIRSAARIDWGWMPLLALLSTLGVLSIAVAYTSARDGGSAAELFLWLGLLLIFVPTTIRLISPQASRFERICLVCIAGIAFFLVQMIYSPLYFSFFDEFLHWRTVNDIASSGHLFSNNPLLLVSPFYPGLEIVTEAFAKLSGLNTFISGTIVVGIARFMLLLALFLLYELITKSARVAGIAMILYMTNPHFLFFDAQFAYESLALPLATLVLFALARYEILTSGRLWITLLACLLFVVVVVTHHVTSYVFDGFLLLWTAIYAIQLLAQRRKVKSLAKVRPQKPQQASFVLPLLLVTFFAGMASAAWMNLPGNPVLNYLTSALINDYNQLVQFINGAGGRQLFVTYSGQVTPLWERLLTLGSVALITVSLPFGLLCLWLRYRTYALVWMFGIVSLLYPVSQVLRFTHSGGEISDRASAFLFIAIACVIAIFITQFWPVQRLNWKHMTLLTTIITIIFLGGIILGNGPASAILPGSYLVSADDRSIEPEGIQSALWTYSYLGSNNRLTTDRINQLLMSAYGNQRPVTPIEDTIDEAAIFISPQLGPYELSVLQQAQVRYIVVDLRFSTALPYVGYYFDSGEPAAFQYTAPIPSQDLTKFNTIPQINRVYDSGNIVIYDAGGLLHAP